MNKVFGYTKKGGKDWFNSDPYSDKEIESIKDPEGGSELTLPTAIPSPFARIDLVKNAFRNVVKSPDLTFYEKDGNVLCSKEDELLVSHCLDLAELLFNYDAVKENLKVIVWDKDSELAKLKNGSVAHRRLAETIELYLDQDKGSYNFDLLDRLYLFEYNHKVIGCTSPTTLFFTTANDLTHAQKKLTNNYLLFGNVFTPLYARESEFQKYLYLLFKSNRRLSQRLNVFADYLDKNLKILNNSNPLLYSEINQLDANDFKNKYGELNAGVDNNVLEVIGIGLRKRRSEEIIDHIAASSDFRINSSKNPESYPPLVLQNDFSKSWMYAKDVWKKFPVPAMDETPLDRRKLPGINVTYPYLTISDFLEPYLIRLVYPVNKEKFFDGNLKIESGTKTKGYILPLKPKFFEYFNSADLLASGNNKPKLEIVQGVAHSVKVALKIPVVKDGEFLTFERTYFQTQENEISRPDEVKNKGIVIEQQFGISLFPFIKTRRPDIKAFYRVQLIDRDIAGPMQNNEYEVVFFQDTPFQQLPIHATKVRTDKRSGSDATSKYFVMDTEFDFLQVQNISIPGANGIVLPNWAPFTEGKETFTFAVDFGTTNTHIEYMIGRSTAKPLDIGHEDLQIASLFHPSDTPENFNGSGAIAIRERIDYEFVPQIIGNNSDYKFPHRTVISESHSLNIDTQTFTLADFNIPFVYERKQSRDKVQSNLKWAKKEKGNDKRVKAFFEKLIMLMRNKVLLNRGNLSQTNLVWFYPSSMKPGRKASLEKTWVELFEDYFQPAHKPIGIAESLAPFYYFKEANKLQGGLYKPVVSVDIGGGTTDIVIFKGGKPLLMTSFKFAANSIFGDTFSEFGAALSNGIVQKYLPHFEKLLSTNNLHDLTGVLFSIKEKNKAEDINAFFFAIGSNPKIKDKELFSYNSILAADDDLKILFVYFYSAIIYHIAGLMKTKRIELPKHLVFSGTGSKLLNIVSSDHKQISNLSKAIFEGVYERKFDNDGLSVETERRIPKEVTCKGGLMVKAEDLDIDIREIMTIYNGESLDGVTLTYEKLDSVTKEKVIDEVALFNSFFIKLNQQINFVDHFSVSPKAWEIFKSEVNKHHRDYLEEGLQFNKELDDITEDKELEESLFFYPLVGTIKSLNSKLANLSEVNV